MRAALAQTIEVSQFTSAQLRLKARIGAAEATMDSVNAEPIASASTPATSEVNAPVDSFFSPIEIDETNDPLGLRASVSKDRCSDKEFLAMPTPANLELLDWTAQQIVSGKRRGIHAFRKDIAKGATHNLLISGQSVIFYIPKRR